MVSEGPHVPRDRQKISKVQKRAKGKISMWKDNFILYRKRVSELGKLRDSVINRDIMTNPFLPFKVSPEPYQWLQQMLFSL